MYMYMYTYNQKQKKKIQVLSPKFLLADNVQEETVLYVCAIINKSKLFLTTSCVFSIFVSINACTTWIFAVIFLNHDWSVNHIYNIQIILHPFINMKLMEYARTYHLI